MTRTEDELISERRCLLTGESRDRAGLIRLALGPDGELVPDLAAKLGGRGAWISPNRPALEAALAKGKLKGLAARTLRVDARTLEVADDLPEQIRLGLERRCLSRLGLENRAGNLTFGFDRILSAIRTGRVYALVHAGDAAHDGAAKLGSALRQIRPDGHMLRLPVARAELSLALGRENVVHAAVTDSGAARRILEDARRWCAFVEFPGSEIGTVRG
ncbi:DUF448 domain-containing protein [Pedomonas sp. V897]|uniref:DUF448 domain-containing protein n=1 Tax=Pedomonas sp. V897 TaxID=3446482 RepID=UPI003EE04485